MCKIFLVCFHPSRFITHSSGAPEAMWQAYLTKMLIAAEQQKRNKVGKKKLWKSFWRVPDRVNSKFLEEQEGLLDVGCHVWWIHNKSEYYTDNIDLMRFCSFWGKYQIKEDFWSISWLSTSWTSLPCVAAITWCFYGEKFKEHWCLTYQYDACFK